MEESYVVRVSTASYDQEQCHEEAQANHGCDDSSQDVDMVLCDGDDDLYRTGAKCVEGMQQDSLNEGTSVCNVWQY